MNFLFFLKQQYYEVPIAMKSVFDLIDTFQSRIKDMEKQKKEGIVCKEDKKQSLENFLSRYIHHFWSPQGGRWEGVLGESMKTPRKHRADVYREWVTLPGEWSAFTALAMMLSLVLLEAALVTRLARVSSKLEYWFGIFG